MKGYVVVLVVEDRREDVDEAAVARVCHAFEATSLGEIEAAVAGAAAAARRQVRRPRQPAAAARPAA